MIFGLASLAVAGLSFWSWRTDPRNVCLAGISLMLLMLWGASNALVAFWGVPEGMRAYPALDLIGLLVVGAAWVREPRAWKLGVIGCFLGIEAAHIAFWIDPVNPRAYAVDLNDLFLLQLGCVAFPGVRHAAGAALSRLRDQRALVRHVDA